MSEYIVEMFGIVQDFADLHGDMNTPLYEAIMDVMLSRQREPIVRCRDCKYLDVPDWDEVLAAQYGEPPASCMRPDGNGDYMRFEVEPDGFCKWGERRNE